MPCYATDIYNTIYPALVRELIIVRRQLERTAPMELLAWYVP